MAASVNLISLRCVNCSANLELSDKLDRFICNYCGTEQLLIHDTSGYSFKRLEDKLDKIEKATEKGNVELALKRLREDLQLKMVQLNAMEEEREQKLNQIGREREDSYKNIVAAAFFQLIILKFDFPFSTYVGLQIMVLGILLYNLRYLGILQTRKSDIFQEFMPDFERVNNEIRTLEIKIKNKIKIVDQ